MFGEFVYSYVLFIDQFHRKSFSIKAYSELLPHRDYAIDGLCDDRMIHFSDIAIIVVKTFVKQIYRNTNKALRNVYPI